MSVVVWDGRSRVIAADRQVSIGDLISPGRKMLRDGPRVYAWTGDTAAARMLIDWHSDPNRSSASWPVIQHTESWTRLIIADAHGCHFFEQHPARIEVPPDSFFAFGAGRDLAMGALAAGADARKAVEIANTYNAWCGFGVELYDLKELK